MDAGQIILILGFILLLADLVVLFRHKSSRKLKDPSFYIGVISFFLIVAAYLVFVNAFVSDDFSVMEVYSHSTSSLPVASKLYASWAGSGGSILLLTILLGAVYFFIRLKTNKTSNSYNIFSSKTIGIILAFFLLLCIMKNPFATSGGVIPPEGGGLNPALQTVYMIVHPPIVFLGYAFLALAFVLVLAGMRTGEQNGEKLIKISTRLSWLFFTVGIALGGLWAYEVLGWGGYWSWDPVETSSLLPWIALTVFFHLNRRAKNKDSFAPEFTILLAFDALIFLSALTRGGLLMSVHAYALSPAGPILLLFALALTVYFLYLKRKANKPLFPLDFDKTSMNSISTFLGVIAMLGISIVCFVGVALPLAHSLFTPNPFTPGVEFYNVANFPFVLLLLAGFVGGSISEKVNTKNLLPIILMFASSIVLALVKWPTGNGLANIGIPFAVGGIIALIYKLLRDAAAKTRTLRVFSRNLLHLGLVLTLIGVFVSAGASQTVLVDSAPNGNAEALGVQLSFTSATSIVSESTVNWYDENTNEYVLVPEYISIQMDATVSNKGTAYKTSISASLYPAMGNIVIAPTIVRTLEGDIYLHLEQTEAVVNSIMSTVSGNFTQPENLTLTLKIVPGINLVWVGCTLLSASIVVSFIQSFTSIQPKPPEVVLPAKKNEAKKRSANAV
jgi:cytochrome c-type biogenesis protein CcmF